MTDVFTGRRYEIVAWGRGETPLVYEEIGSYSGDWLLLAKRPDGMFVSYRGSFGSCSGCDAYEAAYFGRTADYEDEPIRRDSAKVQDFIAGYGPFLEIPATTMKNLCQAGTLLEVFPRNSRNAWGEFDEETLSAFARDAMIEIKLIEGWPVAVDDIFLASNQETRSKVLRAVDVDTFLAMPGLEEIDRADAETRLLRLVRPPVTWQFALVKDGSTDRRYLLRVPPTMTRVKAAIAWTFSMEETEYQPVKET